MVRSPLLRSHLLQYRRLMVLLLQGLCPAHCYHAVQSAHKSLRIPPVMAQVMSCRSLKRSRSSHSLEFLQRCGVSIDPHQPSQPPVPIPLLDAAVQSIPHSTLSQNVSTQMGLRSASSFSVDKFVQTLVRSTVQHDAATQLPLEEFLIGCIYSNSPLDRQNSVRQSPPPMQGSHALLQPPPGLEQPAPPPELAAYSHLLTTHGASTNSFPQPCPAVACQFHPSGEHTLYAQLPAPKGVLVPP